MQVGDIVTFKFVNKEFRGVVTKILGFTDACIVLRYDGDAILIPNERLTKTGEHVDILDVLEKLTEI